MNTCYKKSLLYYLVVHISVYTAPPPPPALPSNLASQSVSQLLQMFSSNQSQSVFASLLATTKLLQSLSSAPLQSASAIQSSSNISILSSVPSTVSKTNVNQKDAAQQIAEGSPTVVLDILNNPNISMAQKLALTASNNTNPDGTPKKINKKNCYQVPPVMKALNKTFASNFTGSTTLQLPTIVFDDPIVTKAYNNFVQALIECPSFLSMFKKIHITALHQLYQYLVGIYVTLNLTNINDLKTYTILENQFGLNKKTLIIMHLVDLIQVQLTQTIQGIMPGMPDQVAIKAGMTSLQNQGTNDLNMFILDMEQSVLALLGMDSLTEDQVATVVAALQDPTNAALIRANSDINYGAFQQALKIMSPTNVSFVQQLNMDQVEALAEAINTITMGTAAAQNIQAVQAIINALESPNTTSRLSSSVWTTFITYINQIANGLPLQKIIALTDSIASKVTSKSTIPFTPDEQEMLVDTLAYLSSVVEKQMTTLITQGIIVLGKSNPTKMQLSVSQQIALRSVASSFRSGSSTKQITELNGTDLKLLSNAFTVFSNNPPDKSLVDYVTTYSTWAPVIAIDPVGTATLISQQPKAFNAALDYLQSYTFSPTTLAQAENEFSVSDQKTLLKAFSAMAQPDFKSFAIFDTETQLLIFDAFQEFDAIMETRLALEAQDAATLQGLLGNSPSVTNALLTGITSNDYVHFSMLYDYLRSLKTTLSAADLANAFGNQDPNPYAALQRSLTPIQNDPTVPGPLSYIDFLRLNAQQNNLSVIQQVVGSLSDDQLQFYKKLANRIAVIGFQFSSLTKDQLNLLLSFFRPLQQSLSQIQTQKTNNTSSNIPLLKKVAALVYGTASYTKIKMSFLWALKQYLLFFNVYTASLSQGSQTQYQFITNFINQAKKVAATVKTFPAQTVNPPLFFYDEKSMRSLVLLPQLATLVENTTYVPYPTFCVEQALNGSTVNPYDGIVYNNFVSMGQGAFSYNKFFFLDSTQQSPQSLQSTVVPELTGSAAQKIPWLKKANVPVSNASISTESGKKIKNYDHVYVVENKPHDVSGFYMNIPTFDTDPSDSTKVLVRLFEQEIIAQPQWLNNSGLKRDAKGNTISGIMTVVRGCMGDFLSLKDLEIFDPVLSFIFGLAMQTTDGIQNPIPDSNFTQLAQQCVAFIQQKALEDQRMDKVASLTSKNTVIAKNQNGGVLNAVH